MSISKVLKKEKVIKCILLIQMGFLIFCFAIIPLIIYLYGHFIILDQSEVIDESYWEISLPKEMKKILKEQTAIGFHGEGIRHSVYDVERSEINIAFRVDIDSEMEKLCMQFCEELKTEEGFVPDFEKKYQWRKFTVYDDTLILLYFVETGYLHIFQDIK